MKTSQTLNKQQKKLILYALNKQQKKLILYAQNFLCADDTISANMNDGGMITIKCYVNDDYHLTDKTFLDVITKNGLLTYTHTNSKGWKLSYDGGN